MIRIFLITTALMIAFSLALCGGALLFHQPQFVYGIFSGSLYGFSLSLIGFMALQWALNKGARTVWITFTVGMLLKMILIMIGIFIFFQSHSLHGKTAMSALALSLLLSSFVEVGVLYWAKPVAR